MRSHRRRFGLALFSVAVVVALSVTAAGVAASGPESVSDQTFVATPFVPRTLGTETGTVVVQLKEKSAAEVQAEIGRELTESEHDQIERDLKSSQDALRSGIEAAGGTVLADYQSALNGIKVAIAPEKQAALKRLPGVKRILPISVVTRDNAVSVPYIGAPQVWNVSPAPNLRGEGIKIGVIDTGIDYTHANFGGPGTVAAYNAANATDTLPADPLLFGPLAPRVKGGFDLVGDAYNASGTGAALVPQPDPNPLDCNGHGSHVAGTAAGSGVTAAGATYAGPYNSSIYTPGAFRIGPGVAPKADIYAYRVFGCTGSTDVTVDAIDLAFHDRMDVINMSLGSPFGTADDASAVASTNAAKAGMVVVASAGNSGPNQYITGAPAAGTGAISVAANDSSPSFPGFTLAFAGGPITGLNANAATVANGTSYTIKRILDNPATTTVNESLGCNVSDYGTLAPNAMAVVVRGVCARVAKAIFGQQAGAAAVAMINTDSGFPPFEGPIFSNPDTGIPFTVTIPFIGIRGVLGPSPQVDPDLLVAADGGMVTLTNTTVTNPNFSGFASFTSGGPRTGDSWLKPDITAPGVSIFSTGSGTGNLPLGNSGTSMASPHVAGVAVLAVQAHDDWPVEDVKAAIVNTGDPAAIGGTAPFRISRGGTGLVQPLAAVKTHVVAIGNPGTASLSFGFEELDHDYSKTQSIKVRNHGSSSATFNVTPTNASGSPHSVALGATSVTVPAGGTVELAVTLNVPVATVGDSLGSGLSFREVAGLVTFTPASSSDNSNVTLRVPYYLVPRALSNVEAKLDHNRVPAASPSATATVTNPNGAIAGTADFYAWGIDDKKNPHLGSNDVRAVGVQSFQFSPTSQLIVFAVNTWSRWSNAATNEFDISVDVDPASGNGDDYVVVGVDQGAVQAGSFNGRMAAFVFSTRSAGATVNFFATAPTDSSTALLPILSSQLCRTGEPCLTAANPRFSYQIDSFDLLADSVDPVAAVAKYNAWTSSITQGSFATLPPGGSANVPITINPAEWALTPALGVMVVSLDNRAGKAEALLLPLALT
ncbi:MAG: S8 family serine peptidase [Actinobacteria bacterium]|nr:S8 family serine peptidase [Actinomycetota bacterium]